MERTLGLLQGERQSGPAVRQQNVQAAIAVANIVRSSLGPTGLDKMLVDDIGEVTVTNDGATILQQLDVEHPAAKVIVQLAGLQDEEVGDGTTSVVLIAAELLKRALELVKLKHHPTTVIAGYRLAQKRSSKFINEVLAHSTKGIEESVLISCAKTSLSSKILGTEAEMFSKIAVDACLAVKKVDARGKSFCPIESINILKSHGKSIKESILVSGFALNCTRASQEMPIKIENAKIALLDFSLQHGKMAMGVQILIKDPTKMKELQEKENDITKERVQKILDSGANVILTSKGIDDSVLKMFVEAKAMGVRRVLRDDLHRLARLTNGKVLLSMADLDGEESFDASSLGSAKEVAETQVGDSSLIYVRDTASGHASSIVLRGPNSFTLEEMERSLHDSLCVVKRVLESKAIVPGGGAVESALCVHLESFAKGIASREQMAVAEFAEALLVIPKTLAINSANDAIDILALLRANHSEAQEKNDSSLNDLGIDLVTGKLRNSVKDGVVEPAISKTKSIAFATEACITILRIDDMIKLEKPPSNPEEG